MNDGLTAAYEYCRSVTKRQAKNFYYGFMLLPPGQRRAIYAVYAFARECDDVVDSGLPAGEAAARLSTYRDGLERCLAGEPDSAVFAALSDAVERYRIQPAYLYDLMRGVEMDLTVRRYETFDDLKSYCHRVAGTIGLVSIQIFGSGEGSDAHKHASDLGTALQLTNILRDVREDAARGRIYLPQEDLRDFGYAESALFGEEVTPEFRGLIAFQAERARGFFSEGAKLLPVLPRRARACVAVMAAIYRRILEEIARDPAIVYRRRVALGAGRKLALAGRELVRSLAP